MGRWKDSAAILRNNEHIMKSKQGAGRSENVFSPSGDVPLAMERKWGEQGFGRAIRVWQNSLEPARGLDGKSQVAAQPKHPDEPQSAWLCLDSFQLCYVTHMWTTSG